MLPTCEKCGRQLRVVPTFGNSDLDDWFCDHPGCPSGGRNQGPRLRGKNYKEYSYLPGGRIDVFQRGRELQNEANVPFVASSLVYSLGPAYCWRSAADISHDFILQVPSNKLIHVQVVRAVDPTFCATLGSNENHEAEQTYAGTDLLKRIVRVIHIKSKRTPLSDRNQSVLAVDISNMGLALTIAISRYICQQRRTRVHEWADRKGWLSIVLVEPNNSNNLWYVGNGAIERLVADG